MPKRIRDFEYRLGQITDGDNKPVSDRAFIEIVDADDPQVLLGEINIEIENADVHAQRIVAALSATPDKYAALVEHMINEKPWSDHLMTRGALAIAGRAIRRGRHFTAKEKLANLKRAINADLDQKMA